MRTGPLHCCRFCRRWYPGAEYVKRAPYRYVPRWDAETASCTFHAPRLARDDMTGEWPQTDEFDRCRHFRRAWTFTIRSLCAQCATFAKWECWRLGRRD